MGKDPHNRREMTDHYDESDVPTEEIEEPPTIPMDAAEAGWLGGADSFAEETPAELERPSRRGASSFAFDGQPYERGSARIDHTGVTKLSRALQDELGKPTSRGPREVTERIAVPHDAPARQGGGEGQTPLSELAGAVGHELYNPLTSCLGYLQQLGKIVPTEDRMVGHMIDRLGRNLNRIHSIVGELELLASEANEARERVDLAGIVRRVHEQLDRFLPTDVELHLTQTFVETDRARLYQLVYLVLATHMLDAGSERWCSVRVSSHAAVGRFEVTARNKPYGSLRLDLLGILRREEFPGADPLQLASQLTDALGGMWREEELSEGYRTVVKLPHKQHAAGFHPPPSGSRSSTMRIAP